MTDDTSVEFFAEEGGTTTSIEDTGPSGDISLISVARVLFEMYAAGVTGALLLKKDGTKKIVYLRSGYPISVKSNNASECLGKILLWDEKITKNQWRESLVIMRQTQRKQGAVLVDMGVLSQNDLRRGLSLQLRFKICETFAWTEGEYKLFTGVRPPPGLPSFDVAPATLIYEGIRSFVPKTRVLQELKPWLRSYLHPSPNPLLRFQDLRASREGDTLLEKIDGTATVDKLLKNSPLNVHETSALLYTLILTEMVTTQSSPDKHWSNLRPLKTQFATMKSYRTPQRVQLARLVEHLRKRSPFQVLGIPDDSPLPTVRRTYIKRATERHPDRLGANESEGLRSLTLEALRLTSEAFLKLTSMDAGAIGGSTSARGDEITRDISIPEASDEELSDGDDRVNRIIEADQYHKQGLDLLEENRFKEAEAALSQAVSLCDTEGTFRTSLAWAIFQTGRDKGSALHALEHLEEAIESGSTARAFVFKGNILSFLEYYDDAMTAFEEALQKEPQNEEALKEVNKLRQTLEDRT